MQQTTEQCEPESLSDAFSRYECLWNDVRSQTVNAMIQKLCVMQQDVKMCCESRRLAIHSQSRAITSRAESALSFGAPSLIAVSRIGSAERSKFVRADSLATFDMMRCTSSSWNSCLQSSAAAPSSWQSSSSSATTASAASTSVKLDLPATWQPRELASSKTRSNLSLGDYWQHAYMAYQFSADKQGRFPKRA